MPDVPVKENVLEGINVGNVITVPALTTPHKEYLSWMTLMCTI